ncbi:MAG: (2Fe-2S)-binding protein [Clostridia bacterium]|nr:(2Fe-2S)-binding protein [Clostridia bacterium]
MKQKTVKVITLKVNGKIYEIEAGEGKLCMPESETLAHTLRDRLDLTGLKIGCDQGACGGCTVIMNGKAVTSCMLLTMDCDGAEIITIEGLADAVTGELSGLQQAFLDHCGYQCGFCTPGIIMTAKALLDRNPNPSEEEVREALSGNYCRCGTHYTAVESIMAYVEQTNQAKEAQA